MATIEELKLRAGMVIDTLNCVLDSLMPLMRLYPQLPAVREDTELAIAAIQRFYRALETWRVPEDIEKKRMREALELLARLGHGADQALTGMRIGETSPADLGYYGAFRQAGEVANRGLGKDWLKKDEGDDADLLA